MKKLRELFSDTLIYGISSVLARFINYLLVPFHTDVFNPSQYGVIGLVYAGIAFLNVLFTFGMESAYLRYAKDRERSKDVFKTLQVGLLVGATGLALLLWLFSPALMPLMSLDPETSNIFLLMLGILWFDTLAIVPFAELRLVRKSFLFAAIRTANVAINLGLNFYLILSLGWGLEAVFVANFAASSVTALLLWILTARMMRGTFMRPILNKAISFGWPFVPAGIGYAINEVLDRFFLETYLSTDTVHQLYGLQYTPDDIVGVYNACYKMAVFMLLLIQMFRMAWQPFFLRHSDDPKAKKLFRDVFRYFNVGAGIMFLVVALFVEQIVQLPVPLLDTTLIDSEYWLGLQIVPVLLAAYWFHGWYMNFSAGIFIEEETKVLPRIMLTGAGITVVANLVMIPFFGMMGSAWATLFSYGTMAMMLYRKSRRVYPVSYPLGRAFGMMLIASAIIFIQPYILDWIGSEWNANLLLLFLGTLLIVVLGAGKTNLFARSNGTR